jgi:hypothetical protein
MASCETKAIWCSASDFAHTDLADPGVAESQGLLDRANHHDAGCPVCQGDGSGREGAENVDDRHCAGRLLRAFEQAVN